MISKEIKEMYKEDRKQMIKEGQSWLIITDNKWKKISKRLVKSKLWDDYRHLVNRALFHYTTWTTMDWIELNFKNKSYFK